MVALYWASIFASNLTHRMHADTSFRLFRTITMSTICYRSSIALSFKPGVSITQRVGWSIRSLLISTTCVLGTLEVATAKGCKDFVWYFSSGLSRKFPSVLLPWPVEPIKRMVFAPRRCHSSDMVYSL